MKNKSAIQNLIDNRHVKHIPQAQAELDALLAVVEAANSLVNQLNARHYVGLTGNEIFMLSKLRANLHSITKG